jgi:hypothetical protein
MMGKILIHQRLRLRLLLLLENQNHHQQQLIHLLT